MKLKKLFFIAAILFSCSLFAQDLFPPTEVIQGNFIGKTGRLDEFSIMEENNDSNNQIMIIDQILSGIPENVNTTTVIPNLQTEEGRIAAFTIEQNFIGASSSESNFFPPDATGAVGPNHYVHSVNSLVKIFDKTGNLLVGPISLSAFLGIPSNSGDPIVLYDQLADRWIVSEFGSLGSNLGLAIGVSETNDPGGVYNVYQYDMNGGFPDYPKYGVWHDGYYGTANWIGNVPGGGGATTAGFVMDREAMIAGDPSPEMVFFFLPEVVPITPYVKSAVPANLIGTDIDTSLPGYITYLQDDGWNGVTYDHLKVWEIVMDWNNTANSTISSPLEIPTDPFDSDGAHQADQPGTNQGLDAHGGIVSFAANYRSFADHNSWVITFNTYIDNDETGGIRWIELRNDDVNPWEIFQEGTYSIADGHSRFMSSSAMDALGNIALAYITGSSTLKASLRYTGRLDGDALGEMTFAETTIIDGNGVRTSGDGRFGDYSHMTMDPDDFTFWYTGDYFSSNNQWRTQIASFYLSGGFAADVGIINILQPNNGALTNSETVEVSIRNFGTDSQSNIPVELRVDGNLVATETYAGTINSNGVANFTFAQTVDLSNLGQVYTIEAKTVFAGDEFEPNDTYTKEVTHTFPNDVGALVITSPVSGGVLGVETITVTLKNFGTVTQSNFDVQYVVDGGSPVIETFAGPISPEEEISYNFTQTFDFTGGGTYNLSVSTSLSGDDNASNDEVSIVLVNSVCQPEANCSLGDGFRAFSVAEINNQSGCEVNGYGDFTNLEANLEPGSTYSLSIITGYGSQNITVWIDFNDDFSFTNDEIVVPNFVIAQGQGAGTYFETVDLVIPANAANGAHIMRARSKRLSPITDACEDVTYGETEDYTANVGSLGVEDYEISNSQLIVTTLPNDQFEVILNTDYNGGVYLGVYNILGQEIGFNKRVPRIDNAYKLKIDMSSMASGVYFINMGGHETTSFKTARIIVK